MSSVTNLLDANGEENPMTRFSAHKFCGKEIKGRFIFIYVFMATARTSATKSKFELLPCVLPSLVTLKGSTILEKV